MLEDLLVRRDEITAEIEEHGDEGGRLMKQLAEINRALGEVEDEDDLTAKWERELAEGRVPDLDEMPE